MSGNQRSLLRSAAELRRAFDESFAAPLPAAPADMRDFLTLRAGAGRYALDVNDLKGLEAHRQITPLPVGDPAVLGVAGIGGRLVPVYALGLLLGESGGSGQSSWLAICGQAEPVALAFDELEGQVRLGAADVYVSEAVAAGRRLAEAFTWAGVTRHVVNVRSILEIIEQRAGAADTPTE
jgi:chemotaxis signal transduction protein